MPSYSKTSASRLKTATIGLQQVFNEVVKYYDNTILEGHRGETSQHEKFVNGDSKVDWPDGKHNSFPSKAIDATPYPRPENWGADHWKDLVHFYQFAAVVIATGKRLGVKIRWGGDWDMDNDYKDQRFDDLIHFEEI